MVEKDFISELNKLAIERDWLNGNNFILLDYDYNGEIMVYLGRLEKTYDLLLKQRTCEDIVDYLMEIIVAEFQHKIKEHIRIYFTYGNNKIMRDLNVIDTFSGFETI